MLCSLTGALLMILGTGFVLRRRVVEPLQTMASHAARVGMEDDLSARLDSDRTDEIGILARSFDHMVATLPKPGEKRKRRPVAKGWRKSLQRSCTTSVMP